MTALILPDGRRVEYSLDATGRVERISADLNGTTQEIASDISYAPFGPVSGLTYGNGLGLSMPVNESFEVTGITTAGIIDRSYSYLPDSLIETITDNISPDSSQGFTYDDYSRLSSAAGAYGDLEYILDLADNRLMVSQDAGSNSTYQYIPGTNLVSEYNTGQATVTCSYDQHGNTVRKGDLHFVYNQRNRLVQVTGPEGSTIVEYGYNALGQRVFKKRPSNTVYFLYDLNGNLVMEYDVEAEKAVEYLWLGSRPVARIDMSHLCTEDRDMDGDVDGRDLASSLAGIPDIAALAGHFGDTANPGQTESVYFYHTDHLGTPQVITDSAGSVVWRADYLPFGKTVIQSLSSIENNLRFPGQYYDEETGLHYNWHRYYDPETGRYLTPDPIGLDGGINLYVYVFHDPINTIDSLGLFGGGFGAYIGFGGEIGINIITCCSENKKVRFIILTTCGGVGVGAKNVPTPPKNSGFNFGGVSSDNLCPRNKTYLRHDISFFTHSSGINGNITGGAPPISGDIISTFTGVGVTWKLCGDAILSKEIVSNCCEKKD